MIWKINTNEQNGYLEILLCRNVSWLIFHGQPKEKNSFKKIDEWSVFKSRSLAQYGRTDFKTRKKKRIKFSYLEYENKSKMLKLEKLLTTRDYLRTQYN